MIDNSCLIARLVSAFISALNERESMCQSQSFFYPMSARSRILHDVLDCNPCDQIHCVRPSDRCIDRIGLAAVQFAVNEVLV
jgi:hypothetical protein